MEWWLLEHQLICSSLWTINGGDNPRSASWSPAGSASVSGDGLGHSSSWNSAGTWDCVLLCKYSIRCRLRPAAGSTAGRPTPRTASSHVISIRTSAVSSSKLFFTVATRGLQCLTFRWCVLRIPLMGVKCAEKKLTPFPPLQSWASDSLCNVAGCTGTQWSLDSLWWFNNLRPTQSASYVMVASSSTHWITLTPSASHSECPETDPALSNVFFSVLHFLCVRYLFTAGGSYIVTSLTHCHVVHVTVWLIPLPGRNLMACVF